MPRSRTNAVLVRDLLTPGGDYDLVNNPSLDPFIRSASVVVDRVYTCSVAKGLTLSTEELRLIESWLAAHFYCQSDPTYQSKSTKGASATFTGQTGMQLESTRYGQTALTLDYSGCLSAINKRAFASIGWPGKVPSEQIPYEQRD